MPVLRANGSFIRAFAEDQPRDRGFLAGGERFLPARTAATAPPGKGGFFGRLEGTHSRAHEAAVDPDGFGNLDPALP